MFVHRRYQLGNRVKSGRVYGRNGPAQKNMVIHEYGHIIVDRQRIDACAEVVYTAFMRAQSANGFSHSTYIDNQLFVKLGGARSNANLEADDEKSAYNAILDEYPYLRDMPHERKFGCIYATEPYDITEIKNKTAHNIIMFDMKDDQHHRLIVNTARSLVSQGKGKWTYVDTANKKLNITVWKSANGATTRIVFVNGYAIDERQHH